MCIEIGCGVKKQCMLHFRLHAKTRTSKLRKVVWQHTGSMVGSIAWILLEIYFSFQQWKNYENQLRIETVIAMSLVYYLFGDSVSRPSAILDAILNSQKNARRTHEDFSVLFSILFCIFPEIFSLLPIFSTFGEIWAKTLGWALAALLPCAKKWEVSASVYFT